MAEQRVLACPRARCWVWVAALLAVCAAAARPCGGRLTRQARAPPGVFFTAEHVLQLGPDRDDALYDVELYYDVELDEASGGLQDTWAPPFAYAFYWDYWKVFLHPSSCLGLAGPLGPYGPLSTWGPVGNAKWNPSALPAVYFANGTDVSCEWCAAFSEFVSAWFDAQDPYGPHGPLGVAGPLAAPAVYVTMYHLNELFFNANNFPHALDVFAPWAPLGPLGPLGALGLLGPFGPLGPHGFKSADPASGVVDGQMRNATGDVQRSLRVLFDDTQDPPPHRVYDLTELYPETTAARLGACGQQDTSWVVEGVLDHAADTDVFAFTSRYNQSVVVTVLPITVEPPGSYAEVLLDVNLFVTECEGAAPPPAENCSVADAAAAAAGGDAPDRAQCQRVLESQLKTPFAVFPATGLYGLVDFAVFAAAPGRRYEVGVWGAYGDDPTASGRHHYRLAVTGSGFLEGHFNAEEDRAVFSHLNVRGPHLHSF